MTIAKQLVCVFNHCQVVAIFVLASGAFLTLFVDANDPAQFSAGSPILKLAWGLLYCAASVRLLRRRRQVVPLARNNQALCCLILLALASVLWSIDPSTTLHMALTLALAALVALDVCLRYTVAQQLQLLSIALLLVVALSVIAETLAPGLVPGRDLEGPAWHGVFGWKNDFGRVICLTVIVCLARWGRSPWLQCAILAGGVGLAALSRSASAVGYILMMSALFHTWSIFRWKPVARRTALAAIAVLSSLATYFVATHLAQVTASLGKDPHLTGRVDLWRLSLEDIRQKPLLGYGFQAFWNKDSQPARRIREEINWDDAPHAHNGYIDIALSLGLAGLLSLISLLRSTAIRAYRYFMAGRETHRRWPITFLAMVAIYQLTESSVVSGNSLLWIVLASIAISLTPAREPRPAWPAAAVTPARA
jgi:O-antigen ligase